MLIIMYFSDEATFCLNGTVNRKNVVRYSRAGDGVPDVKHEVAGYPLKVQD